MGQKWGKYGRVNLNSNTEARKETTRKFSWVLGGVLEKVGEELGDKGKGLRGNRKNRPSYVIVENIGEGAAEQKESTCARLFQEHGIPARGFN